jgi:glycosyltransferase involved in cell wall biosynthesis
LESFAQFHFNYNRNSRLLVVGKGGEGLSPYSQLLHRATEMLGLGDAVIFTGGVSEEALKAYYKVADVFVTTSEHEGFCVPLVEAMSMELPIAAYAGSAIPETLGDAGLCWEERDPFLLAETLDVITKDAGLRANLAARALRRYRQTLRRRRSKTSFLTGSLLGAMKRVAIVVQRCHESVVGGRSRLPGTMQRFCAIRMTSMC